MAKALYVPKYFESDKIDEVLLCIEYDEEWDETTIYPNNDKFDVRLPSFRKFLSDLEAAGFNVVGGHEYAVMVAGNPCKLDA